MSKWIHKFRAYWDDKTYSSNEHPSKFTRMGSRPHKGYHPQQKVHDSKDWMSFEEWIDWQCEDGWELFQVVEAKTQAFVPWCVFRKEIIE